jgi:hypothetical protein
MSTAAPTTDPTKPPAERALAAVPVVLTALATILAGLSSSEMTQSMYYRSLAAQDQAKAGSQWAFFQAKRIRGTTMESGGDLIRAISDPPALDAVGMRAGLERIESAIRGVNGSQPVVDAANRLRQLLTRDSVRQSLKYVAGPDLPPAPETQTGDAHLQSLLTAVEERKTEAETAADVAQISTGRIEEELTAAERNADTFDKACKPIIGDLRAVEKGVTELANEIRSIRRSSNSDNRSAVDEAAGTAKELLVSVRAAKQDFTARRYAKEAAYNQKSAELFEILVRRTGTESDRHRTRSRNFFYAMLCAQAGVTIAAFALARSRKSWFWAVAGVAGALAVSFGAYVYLAL